MSPSNNKARLPQENEFLRLLGRNARKWREQKGYTQEEFAPIAGFTRSYITEIETGRRNISFLNFVRIIRFLGVDAQMISDLFREIWESKEK
jgi:transcriptional regulator with XRE-family HTH domain